MIAHSAVALLQKALVKPCITPLGMALRELFVIGGRSVEIPLQQTYDVHNHDDAVPLGGVSALALPSYAADGTAHRISQRR